MIDDARLRPRRPAASRRASWTTQDREVPRGHRGRAARALGRARGPAPRASSPAISRTTRPPRRRGGAAGSTPATWCARTADGMLYFVDRKKNIIRRSGENIAAAEVEAVLQAHDAVAQVAVLAVPDELREEEVMACVVPMPGVTPDAALAERSSAGASSGSPTSRRRAGSSSSTHCRPRAPRRSRRPRSSRAAKTPASAPAPSTSATARSAASRLPRIWTFLISLRGVLPPERMPLRAAAPPPQCCSSGISFFGGGRKERAVRRATTVGGGRRGPLRVRA